jgi:hypothetical protein
MTSNISLVLSALPKERISYRAGQERLQVGLNGEGIASFNRRVAVRHATH